MSLFPYFIISTWKIKSICEHYGSYTAESEIDEKVKNSQKYSEEEKCERFCPTRFQDPAKLSYLR